MSDPQKAIDYVSRGNASFEQGDFAQSIADFNKAIELDPKEAAAYSGRGLTNYLHGNLRHALDDCNEAVRLEIDFNNYESRGQVSFALGQFPAALADFDASLKLKPTFKSALAGRAISQHAVGTVGEAKTAWRELIENDEQFKDADWVGKELEWRPELIEEARKLIEGL